MCLKQHQKELYILVKSGQAESDVHRVPNTNNRKDFCVLSRMAVSLDRFAADLQCPLAVQAFLSSLLLSTSDRLQEAFACQSYAESLSISRLKELRSSDAVFLFRLSPVCVKSRKAISVHVLSCRE